MGKNKKEKQSSEKRFVSRLAKSAIRKFYENWKGQFSHDEIEEVVSDTVSRVFDYAGFKKLLIADDEDAARAYFFRAVRNSLINKLHREERVLPLSYELKNTSRDPLYYAIVSETERISYDIVNDLLNDKIINDLRLAYMYSRSAQATYKEIGQQTGMSISTVEYRIKHTISRIIDMLIDRGFRYNYQFKIFFHILLSKLEFHEPVVA